MRIRHGVCQRYRSLWLGAMVLLGGCTFGAGALAPVLTECAPPARRLLREVLYFGLTAPGGARIDAAAWQAFLTESVTPRLASGYTVIDAAGQWLDGGGRLVHEPSKILIVLHAAQARSAQAVADIIQAYKVRFGQESVLRETTEVCAEF